MPTRTPMEVSIAVAKAVQQADVDVIAAYPITPQTHIVEHLSELVANGELQAHFMNVESEHSAISAMVGAAAAGASTFTATSSQGLALMHEILFIAASLRLPIVMVVANRALSGPISIWNDHSDIMAERDIGWIQVFCETGQEAYDAILHAFRVVRDPNVVLPMVVNIDGFNLTHVIEPIYLFEQEELGDYLPEHRQSLKLDIDHPITMGPVGIPEVYTEAKKQVEDALINSKQVILAAWQEFGRRFGRAYAPIETYRVEDAQILLMTMGVISRTAMGAVDRLRDAGKPVGLIRCRLWRPFPLPEFREAVRQASIIAVIDRHISLGAHSGPVGQEVRSALYTLPNRPQVFDFVLGLGGRDVTVHDFLEIVELAEQYATQGPPESEYTLIGLREV
ncbi:MAG: pyruvate ferredoxin oxidoreductase [Desulfobacca sp.]|nr:pyruvate ferredoxin oxidoreductase [Desulfobacca sp.]